MQLPPILPLELEDLRKIEDPRDVFNTLIQNPSKMLLFFEVVSDDDVWINRNPDFLRQIMGWLTHQYFLDKLDNALAERATANIYSHFASFRTLIPATLTVIADNKQLSLNSMLMGMSSPIFRELIRIECRDKNKAMLKLMGMSGETLVNIAEYITEGTLENLWKESREDILSLLRQADQWQLKGLSQLCQESLHRYIDQEHVFDLLILSQSEDWLYLKGMCSDYFNTLGYFLKLHQRGEDDLALELYNFSLGTLEVFKKIAPAITHLIFRGNLPEDPAFIDVMNDCPKLKGLDLSETSTFSKNLIYIPRRVIELDLARCPWLTDRALSQLVDICSQVNEWNLAFSDQLTYQGFSTLQYLPNVIALSVANCYQMTDQDLMIILRSCHALHELNLAGCRLLSEDGLMLIARLEHRLIKLNLSRTVLSDRTLVEIVSRLPLLESLDVTKCAVSPDLIAKLKRDYPNVGIIF